MPATTYIALKPHRDIASGRVLRPDDEITSEEDLIAAFPSKFKLKGGATPVVAVTSTTPAEPIVHALPATEPRQDTKTPAKTPPKS